MVIRNSEGVGGSQRPQCLKEKSMKLNLNFQRSGGGGFKVKTILGGGTDIFWNHTTQLNHHTGLHYNIILSILDEQLMPHSDIKNTLDVLTQRLASSVGGLECFAVCGVRTSLRDVKGKSCSLSCTIWKCMTVQHTCSSVKVIPLKQKSSYHIIAW